ncbi:MAG: DMT family transporter [Anaerolineae bacterium]|jgi:drug/metabolite transporter (DMT)-like permease
MMDVSRFRFLLSLGVGIVAISFASIFIRLAQGEGVPTLSIAAWRLIVASAVLLPYAWITRRDEIRSLSGQEWRLLAASGVFLGLHFATWIASLAYTSVASSVVLVSMGPVFVGLGSWIFLQERPGRQLAIGIVVAAVGSIIISGGDLGQGGDQLWGDLLALTGAIMIASYLMIGRKVRAARSLITYVALVYGVAMVVVLLIVAVTGQPMLGFSPAAYGWMLALGLVSQIVGHSTLNWALHYLTATYVSLVTLSEPVGSGILAYLLLDEQISSSTILGGLLVLVGIYVASQAELGPSRKEELPPTRHVPALSTNPQTEGENDD